MANYLVISATSDIAKETLELLKNKGSKLFITSRNSQQLNNLKSVFACEGAILDATKFDDVEKIFVQAQESLGKIDGVVCFAGSVILKPAHLTSENEFFATISANLTTAFAVTRAAGKIMKNGGSVVLISSAAAMQGIANHEAIAAAKGGIISLAKSAAATYAAQNLRFNVVAPGLIKTRLTQKITDNENSLKFSVAMHALGRIGEVQDVAQMVTFLLGSEANFITGQLIAVDGGLSNLQPKIK